MQNNERDEELDEALGMLSTAMLSLMRATIIVTCTVYLRPHCKLCVERRLIDEMPGFLEQHGELMRSDMLQFMRQWAIRAKDFTEAEMQKPCTIADEPEKAIAIIVAEMQP